MANTDQICGFKPVRHLNGNPWNGKARMYYISADDTTALFIGDAVVTDSNAESTGKYSSVTKAATTGAAIRGVIIGFSDQPYVALDTTDLNRAYRPADTAMYCLVVDDPAVIFEIQEDGDGNTIAAASVGLNADIVFTTAGDTSNGKSGMELDSSSAATTATLPCRILGASNKEDNALGAHCKWDILFNLHELRDTTGVQ